MCCVIMLFFFFAITIEWVGLFFFFQAEVGIRDKLVTGVQTCALPISESWTSDRVRLKRTGVPTEHRTARTKPEIALAEIDRMIAAGVHFGCVLADSSYGMSAPFRHALTERGLLWAVGIPRHLKVYPIDVR